MKHERKAIIRMPLDLVEAMLGLDKDHHIIAARVTEKDFSTDTVQFKVIGPDCPEVPEGDVMPWVVVNNGKIVTFDKS
jgi:hypothetical protein